MYKLFSLAYFLSFQNDFKTQELPLARIKKIMKLDEDVKMISQEAPLLFAKAAEIFISELALRSWVQTEDSKRRTLQVSCQQMQHIFSYFVTHTWCSFLGYLDNVLIIL